ncbi:MAG: BLUF domain-containing protein [Blastomonas sp.]|nr:BLUF domain-containing protein [Blastomonas sp.]
MTGAPVIEQLLYISTVSPGETVDLETILAIARRNNRAAGITGLLMYNGKRFLQVLEGPSEAIEATFDRIRRDPRHRGHVLLARKTVERREFGDWSMGFKGAADGDTGALYDTICAKVANVSPNLRAELTAFASNI